MPNTHRYPLEPLAHLAGITLGTIGGFQPGQPLHGLKALAERLDISHQMAQRLKQHGLSEPQADRYAAALGYHPANVWPDWFDTTCNDIEPGDDTQHHFDF